MVDNMTLDNSRKRKIEGCKDENCSNIQVKFSKVNVDGKVTNTNVAVGETENPNEYVPEVEEVEVDTPTTYASSKDGSMPNSGTQTDAREQDGTIDHSGSNVSTGVPVAPHQSEEMDAHKVTISDISTVTPSGIPLNPVFQTVHIDNHVILEEKSEVSTQFVGRVIGKGGEMIRDLQARSGCRIDVDQNVPDGDPRIITYRGNRKTIDFAKQLVQILCSENGNDAVLPLGEAVRNKLVVPVDVIGKIIGRGGEMIRELQSKSQGRIQVDHSGADGIDPNMRQVTIIGNELSVIKAKEMINFIIANRAMDAMAALSMLICEKSSGGRWGSGPPYISMPNNGQGMQGHDGYGNGGYGNGGYGNQPQSYGYGGECEVFACAKMYMGRVIGQKGVTINDLQKRSGCNIQVNQDVPIGHDCQITIKGPRHGIDIAKQMLTEIIQIGPNHPYAGGGGAGHIQVRGYNYEPYGLQQQPCLQMPHHYSQTSGAQQSYNDVSGKTPHYMQAGHQYYNHQTRQYPSQPLHGILPISIGQQPSWKTSLAPDGQTYYYHEQTGETSWQKPPEML